MFTLISLEVFSFFLIKGIYILRNFRCLQKVGAGESMWRMLCHFLAFQISVMTNTYMDLWIWNFLVTHLFTIKMWVSSPLFLLNSVLSSHRSMSTWAEFMSLKMFKKNKWRKKNEKKKNEVVLSQLTLAIMLAFTKECYLVFLWSTAPFLALQPCLPWIQHAEHISTPLMAQGSVTA